MTTIRNLTPFGISPADIATMQADFDERGACRTCCTGRITSPAGTILIPLHVDIDAHGEFRATSGALMQVVGAIMYPDRFLVRPASPKWGDTAESLFLLERFPDDEFDIDDFVKAHRAAGTLAPVGPALLAQWSARAK
jgi:hypothetical protein